MLQGRAHYYDAIEYRLVVDGDGSGSGPRYLTADVGGTLETFWTSSTLDIETGFILRATVLDDLGTKLRGYNFEFLGVLHGTPAQSGGGPATTEVHFVGVTVYNDGTAYKLKVDEVRWIVEGSVEWSDGPYTFDATMYLTPSSLPIIGVPPHMYGGAGAGFEGLRRGPCFNTNPQPPDWEDSSGSASGTIRGGYRWKIDGTYYTFPIESSLGTPPSGVTMSDIGGDDTYSAEFSVSGSVNASWATHTYINTSAQCWIFPNNASVKRMEDDYMSLVARWAMPEMKRRQTYVDTVYHCPSQTVEEESDEEEGFPPMSQFLGLAEKNLADIDDPFEFGVFMPYFRQTVNRQHSPTGSTNREQVWRDYCSGSIDSSTGVATYLRHDDWLPTLANTWGARHWSFAPWFPPDESDSSVRWDLAGSDSDIDYWYQIRQQHCTHPALPSDGNKKRVNVCIDPIHQNGLTDFTNDALAGLPCWWGAREFSTLRRLDHPSSFTTNEESADRYHFYDGDTPSTGSVSDIAIELTTGYVIEFDMASFTAYPYMTPTLADRVTIPNISNTDSFLVFAIGTDGTEKLICSGPGTYRIPYGDAEKWASDAVQEFGAGYISDSFDPIAANNFSGGTFLFDTRTSSSLLLPAFSPEKIRIEVIKTNPGLPCFMAHPTFLMAPWADAKVFHETGRISTVLFKDGPCARFGALSFYDYGLDMPISEPLVADISMAPTIGDLWAWENCFLRGRDALTDLDDRREDEFEDGVECTLVDHLWRNPFGLRTSLSSFVNSDIGPIGVYYNSYRAQSMPTSILPTRLRLAEDGWRPGGDVGMSSYTSTKAKHPVIVPGTTPPHLVDTVDILEDSDAPSGWTVRTHSIAVDNNEGYDYTLKWDNRDWFDVRPWRGWLSVLAPAPSLRNVRGVWHLMTKDGRFLNSWTNGSGAFAKWWHWILPRGTSGISTVASGAQYYQCRVSEDARHRIYAAVSSAVDNDFTVHRTASDDGGKTWNELEEMDIPNGRYATNAHNNAGDMLEAAFVFDSGTDGPGTIQYLVRGGGDLTFAGPFTAKDSTGTPLSAADGSFQMSFAHDSAERVVLSFIVFGDTTPSNWFCTDFHSGGGTFTQFI